MRRWGDGRVVGRCTNQVTRADTGRPNRCLAALKLWTGSIPGHWRYLCLAGMWDARQCGESVKKLSTGLAIWTSW